MTTAITPSLCYSMPMLLEASRLACVTREQRPEMTARPTRSMVSDVDRNTMIVRLFEAMLCFAAAVVFVLRIDRLWLRLRELQLSVGKSFKVYLRFFRPDERSPPTRRGSSRSSSATTRGTAISR